MRITEKGGVHTNFLNYNHDRYLKMRNLDAVVDRLNKTGGSETVIIASQYYKENQKYSEVLKFSVETSINRLLGFGYGIIVFFTHVISILVKNSHKCSTIFISFHNIGTFRKCFEIRYS